jgi:hypothetical protein
MGKSPDSLAKKFGPMRQKTLPNALAHRIAKEFPRIGGPRIRQLCAEMILEVVGQHQRPRERVGHGQALWMAISVDDPPHRQTLAETDLVAVVLDVSTAADIEARLARQPPRQRLCAKAVRLCQQAYQQGALLSNCDLAELLNVSDSDIAKTLVEHERQTGQVVPRRATIHDVGTGLTHKRIICRKRYVEGKTSDLIARETYHSMDAVDRYLGQYDRVRHCRQEKLSAAETAQLLDCSLSLVEEYLAIDRELDGSDACRVEGADA